MPNYRRAFVPGATYFFTVNLERRHHHDLLTRHVELLRSAVRDVRRRHPFKIHGWVVLPDHLHCVLELPPGDSDYPTRWRLIKSGFSRRLPVGEERSASRRRHSERGIWQRRFWEHLVRDEQDFAAHLDYVHINPVRHGLVDRVSDWPFSTFHSAVDAGVYPLDWAGSVSSDALDYPD